MKWTRWVVHPRCALLLACISTPCIKTRAQVGDLGSLPVQLQVDEVPGNKVVVESGTDLASRPQNVPRDFRATPFGYFHASCVHEIDRGERLGAAGRVEHPGGSVRMLQPCEHPNYDRSGNARSPIPAYQAAPYAWAWAAMVYVPAQPLQFLSATWKVPGNPAFDGAQTVYIFPGIESAAPKDTIVQPVLQWNAVNDHRWTISSWLCCQGGYGVYSPMIPVLPGQDILGSSWGTGCDPDTGICEHWQTTTSVAGGGSTTLDAVMNGRVMDVPVAAALEAYDLQRCDQYPGGRGGVRSVRFEQINSNLIGGVRSSPTWMGHVADVTPSCSVAADWDSGGATLSWCVPGLCTTGGGDPDCFGLCYKTIADGCGGVLYCNVCPASRPYSCGDGFCRSATQACP